MNRRSETLLALLAIGLLLVAGCSQSVTLTPMEQAQSDFDTARWDEAIAACTEAIAQNPEDGAAYLLRGRAQQCRGRLDQAVADLTVAIRLNPQDPEGYYQRANAYRDLGQLENKKEDNLKGRELDSNYAHLFKPEAGMTLDLTFDDDELNRESDGKAASKEADDLGLPKTRRTDSQPKRGIVEDMFGMPPDLEKRDRPEHSHSRSRPQASSARSWAPPIEAETPSTTWGLFGPETELEDTHGLNANRGVGSTRSDRRLPADRGGVAGGADRATPDVPRGKQGDVAPRGGGVAARGGAAGAPSAAPKRGPYANRNLNPYAPSSMRPTGWNDPPPMPATAPYEPPSLIDPYGGLSTSRGRAAAGTTPNGRLPSVSVPRVTVPSGPAIPAPPGNRYDGGRGY